MHAGSADAVICDEAFERQIDLPDQHAIGIRVDDAPHLFDDAENFRLIRGIGLQHTPVRPVAGTVIRIGRVIAERRVLHQMP